MEIGEDKKSQIDIDEQGELEEAVTEGLAEYVDVVYLEPAKTSFYRTPGGVIALKLEDKTYPRVNLHRAFPFSLGDKYISVREGSGQEIGIITDLDDFDEKTRGILKEELERRYFTPEILCINSVKSEFGYSYWEVETDRGHRRFTVKGRGDSVIPIDEVRYLIMDMDGNRFEISDIRKLDRKSKKYLEGMI